MTEKTTSLDANDPDVIVGIKRIRKVTDETLQKEYGFEKVNGNIAVAAWAYATIQLQNAIGDLIDETNHESLGIVASVNRNEVARGWDITILVSAHDKDHKMTKEEIDALAGL